MSPGNYISTSVKSCKFIKVSPMMDTSELLNLSLKSGETVKKRGLADMSKGVLPITMSKKRCIWFLFHRRWLLALSLFSCLPQIKKSSICLQAYPVSGSCPFDSRISPNLSLLHKWRRSKHLLETPEPEQQRTGRGEEGQGHLRG